jgi:hypothetical protein
MIKRIICLLAVFLSFSWPASSAPSAAASVQAERFERYYGLWPDEEEQKRIKNIGRRLVEANGLPPEDFFFGIVNSADINAVTLPGGYIYVFKGLLDFLPTDEELAAVIGHEIGHAARRHIARREREQLLTLLLAAIAGSPEAGIAVNAALASLPAYSQRDEREADDSGLAYLLRARMNPYAPLVVMNKLADAEEGRPESPFAQHPAPAARARRLLNQLEKALITPRVEETKNGAWLRDGEWSLCVTGVEGGNKPLYRAWLLAGNLYAVAQKKPLSPDKFIVSRQKTYADIYYEDQLVYRISETDLLKEDTLSGKAAEFVDVFRNWAAYVKTR